VLLLQQQPYQQLQHLRFANLVLWLPPQRVSRVLLLQLLLLLSSPPLHRLHLQHRLLRALRNCLHWLHMHLLLQSLLLVLLLHHQLRFLGPAPLQLLPLTLS
jgi:hypothetical protein